MMLFSESLDIFDKINYKSGDEKYLYRINRKNCYRSKNVLWQELNPESCDYQPNTELVSTKTRNTKIYKP
jgi:hypothetical protein